MSTDPFDTHPYAINVTVKDPNYWGSATPFLDLSAIHQYNRSCPTSYRIYREDLTIKQPPVSLCPPNITRYELSMRGLRNILETLPQDEAIESSIMKMLLISYFGNGAKKKLAELKTPKDVRNWITDHPLDVLETMGIKLPDSRPGDLAVSDADSLIATDAVPEGIPPPLANPTVKVMERTISQLDMARERARAARAARANSLTAVFETDPDSTTELPPIRT